MIDPFKDFAFAEKTFKLERDGIFIGEFKATDDSKGSKLDTLIARCDVDIRQFDIVISSKNIRYVVTEIKINGDGVDFEEEQSISLEVEKKYDKYEYWRRNPAVTSSSDKEDIERLIAALEGIEKNTRQPEKGCLASFGDLLSKHEWLTTHIASIVIDWLFKK